MITQYADYVDPYIGSISHLLKSTRPEAFLPHCYPKSAPIFDDNTDYYCNEILRGLPMGLTCFLPGRMEGGEGEFHNTVDHSRVEAHPYGYSMELEDDGPVVQAGITEHAYIYRLTNTGRVLMLLTPGSAVSREGDCLLIHARGDREKRQFEHEYLRVALDCPFEMAEVGDGAVILSPARRSFVMTGALSFISFRKAGEIAQKELEGRTFDSLWECAREIWNRQLSLIKVTGQEKGRLRTFYTAIYRAFQRMVNYGEYGEYFSAFDNQVHKGGSFYTNDHIWDTFRCMHPLQLLLEPRRQEDILESYNLMYRQSGLMPSCPNVGGDLPVMIGFHAAAIFADAKAKGLEADYATAYEGIRKNAMEQSMLPWVCGAGLTELENCYFEKGFYPALRPGEEEWIDLVHQRERRQSVSVTLEHSYDDWCAAQLAGALGREDEYRLFMRRGGFWKNVFNPQTGFMSPKDKNGGWIEFDPMWSGGNGGRDYFTENNTYVYTWSVFHDIQGLKELLGGDRKMEERLDRLFTEGVRVNGSLVHKYGYFNQYPDATGLMGQFAMGNEPSFHIPYLYDYCGRPWKAQKRLRDLMDIWFTDSPVGICGDEDGGAMSSFFVFSAMGFYPVCPGKPEYAIGTPLFDHIEISPVGGASFTIKALGAEKGLRYIQQARLNGKRLRRPFLTHQEIQRGGVLELTMGRRPSKACFEDDVS